MHPGPDAERDWTTGPAKWAAALVIALASIGGMAWSIVGRAPNPTLSPVPAREAERAATAAPPADSPQTGTPEATALRLIDVNSASSAELQLLPGIGPALAGRIIADREANGPFESLDDLQRIAGIGPRTVERLEVYATASRP